MSNSEEAFVADGGAPEYQEGWAGWKPPSGKVSWRRLVEREAREVGDDELDIRHWEPEGVDLDAEFDWRGGISADFRAWSSRLVYFADEDALGCVTVRSVPRHPEKYR